MMLPAHWTQRASLVMDLVKCWGCGGRTIVFTETKNDANELSGAFCCLLVCLFAIACAGEREAQHGCVYETKNDAKKLTHAPSNPNRHAV